MSAGSDARLFAGGAILTLAGGPPADAIAIREGRIVAVGSLADCRDALGAGHAETDLAGRALLPGFVDAHAHPLMLGQTWSWVDVSPVEAPTIKDLVETLRRHAADLPPGEPLYGYGYNHRRLVERRHPTADDLDRVATDRDVYVMNQSGHGGVLNHRGLRSHGITRDTPDVPGGQIRRDAAGHPTGLVMDAACDLLTGPDGVKIANHGPNLHLPAAPETLDAYLETAQRAFLAGGVTSLVDAQVTRRELTTYLRALQRNKLRVRVGLRVLSAFLDELLSLGLTAGLGGPFLDLVGVKIYADGTLGGWTAWFPSGYCCEPGNHGLLYHTPEQLADIVRRCHAAGVPSGTHAQSPGAIGLVLDAVAAATAHYGGHRVAHTIEHCGLPRDTEIDRMLELGVRPVMQPAHHLLFGDGVLEAVGEELGMRYNPAGLFDRAGMLPVLSSDAPVSEPRPLQAVQAAVERRTVNGTELGSGELRLDVLTALRAHTIGGAQVARRAHDVGTIEVGKAADLVVISEDPTTVEIERIGSVDVEETWVAGRRVGRGSINIIKE
ncbi:MAG TPA: amidohydrolase [Thermoleophilaceae bacterium]|jgi:predicted amidohydrolase YtcJ|nr:amidohydrolase [Thermoleophilaceae bacterium]